MASDEGVPEPSAFLGDVERKIVETLRSPFSPLTDSCLRVASAGGKRLRACLVLLAARAARTDEPDDAEYDRLIAAATCVELLHVGAMIHDDVLDAAPSRRSVDTINAIEGNHLAILAGDMILARANRLCAALGSREVRVLSAVLDDLCTGQALESSTIGQVTRSESDYLQSIAGKTASLISGACELGAMQVVSEDEPCAALAAFGMSFGYAFQILDDLVDILHDEDESGKPSMQDARVGIVTLPLIAAFRADPSLATLLGAARHEPASLSELRRQVIDSRALSETLLIARRHLQQATAHLESLGTPAAFRLTAYATGYFERVGASMGLPATDGSPSAWDWPT